MPASLRESLPQLQVRTPEIHRLAPSCLAPAFPAGAVQEESNRSWGGEGGLGAQ